MLHPETRPVERECICPSQPNAAHTEICQAQFRAKFFGAWGATRAAFYQPQPVIGHDGAFGMFLTEDRGEAAA